MLPSLKKRGVLCPDHLYPGVFFFPLQHFMVTFVLDHLSWLHSDYFSLQYTYMTYPIPQI